MDPSASGRLLTEIDCALAPCVGRRLGHVSYKVLSLATEGDATVRPSPPFDEADELHEVMTCVQMKFSEKQLEIGWRQVVDPDQDMCMELDVIPSWLLYEHPSLDMSTTTHWQELIGSKLESFTAGTTSGLADRPDHIVLRFSDARRVWFCIAEDNDLTRIHDVAWGDIVVITSDTLARSLSLSM